MKKIIMSTLCLMVIIGLVFSHSSVEASQPLKKDVATQETPAKDIVEIAINDGRFTTLVTALKAADLVDTLKGEGPYTVFAPTDDAFKKLSAEKLSELLKPENKALLVDILTYHVLGGKVMAADALKLVGKEVKMANGKTAKITAKDGHVYIDDAKIIITDIPAKNGVIHVIDAVMLP